LAGQDCAKRSIEAATTATATAATATDYDASLKHNAALTILFYGGIPIIDSTSPLRQHSLQPTCSTSVEI